MKNLVLPFFLIFSVLPIFIGFGAWMLGRYKHNRKLRHNGFIMMMISLLLIFIILFTLAASLFYTYLVSNQ
ncbi:MAG: hypothetical protein ACYCYI_00830 [Saccharofermentanales bacterium]